MHLFTLHTIINAASPKRHIAYLVASSNIFYIMLYLFIDVLFDGNKNTTATTWVFFQMLYRSMENPGTSTGMS